MPSARAARGFDNSKGPQFSGWVFTSKTNIVWYKVRKDGGPDRRRVGFYFRNVTEVVLFGVRGSIRTAKPGRTQPNILISQKRGHSRKPDELYKLIERCSYGPFLELFARYKTPGWIQWGNEIALNGAHLVQHAGYRGPREQLNEQTIFDTVLRDH